MANTKKGGANVNILWIYSSQQQKKYFPSVIEQVYNKFLPNRARILWGWQNKMSNALGYTEGTFNFINFFNPIIFSLQAAISYFLALGRQGTQIP